MGSEESDDIDSDPKALVSNESFRQFLFFWGFLVVELIL